MISPEASQALLTLSTMGFRLTYDTGSFRLIRQWGSQADYYAPTGGFAEGSGNLGNVSGASGQNDSSVSGAATNFEASYQSAILAAVPLATQIINDETARRAMPQWIAPSTDSRPYG